MPSEPMATPVPMTRPEPSATRSPRQERTRESLARIRRVAADILTREGVEAFSMAAIAERAGVSVTAIYRRFESKDDLLLDTKRQVMGDLVSRVAAAIDGAGSAAGDVVGAYAACLGAYVHDRRELMSVLIASSHTDPMQKVGDDAVAEIRELFVEGLRSRGRLSSARDESAAVTVWEVLTFLPLHRVVSGVDVWRAERDDPLILVANNLLDGTTLN